MRLLESDSDLLKRAVKSGDVVLVLGAGASATSLDRAGQSVTQSNGLAKRLAEEAGLNYSGESLWEVISAAKSGRLSDQRFITVLKELYENIVPSSEIEQLFDYTWRRVYTWNIDDAIRNIRSLGVQRKRFNNGMSDKSKDFSDLSSVDIVNLHGSITHPEHGFILSEQDYNRSIAANNHDWYRRAVQDYLNHVPIFVGSRLNEPILSLEIDRAKLNLANASGRGFLITPDDLSEIQRESLASKNIIVVNGTLDSFVSWLRKELPGGSTPKDAYVSNSEFANTVTSKLTISAEDLEVARSIFPVDPKRFAARVAAWSSADRELIARQYLRGAPPTWEISSTDIPVSLSSNERMYLELLDAVESKSRMFVVYGQSGSGKTTALMQCLLRLASEKPELPIYEMAPDVRSIRHAFSLLSRLYDEKHVIVHVGDAFIFGDSLAQDIAMIPSGRVTVVASARSGEWKEHLERYLGDVATQFKHERFSEQDIAPLIDRLVKYVPAPSFRRMRPEERIKKIRSSKSQLLIALREATESENFSDVISHEFEALPYDEARLILAIVGISTLARVGIDPAVAREAYDQFGFARQFEDARRSLEGIVIPGANGRVFARHELYVRHIIEAVIDLDVILDVIIAVMRTFTKYDAPIIKSVGRQDMLLFRFILNHNFVKEICAARGDARAGLRIYKEFEVDFQLDGHFWLQYGQYLKEVGELDEALVMLERSIRAYSDNPYAVHAYAEVKLLVAKNRSSFDVVTASLISSAVRELLDLDAAPESEWDQYPIVTLAYEHVGALERHGRRDEAKRAATTYFERLQYLEKRISAQPLTRAKERLVHFITFGEWPAMKRRNRARPRSRPRRN